MACNARYVSQTQPERVCQRYSCSDALKLRQYVSVCNPVAALDCHRVVAKWSVTKSLRALPTVLALAVTFAVCRGRRRLGRGESVPRDVPKQCQQRLIYPALRQVIPQSQEVP